MAITFPAVFQSSIATDPAATTAGYLTPARHNAGCAPAGLTTGRILVPSSATAFTDSADFTFNVSTGVLTLGGSTAGAGLVVTGGTITASSPLFSGTQTWNNAGTTFIGWSLNITDGGTSGGNSRIFQIQAGGGGVTDVLYIARNFDLKAAGSLFCAGVYGSVAGTGIAFANSTFYYGTAGVAVWGTSQFAQDLTLSRNAAGVLQVGTTSSNSLGTVQAHYNSSDGTAGITFASQAVTAITVKDGLIVAKTP